MQFGGKIIKKGFGQDLCKIFFEEGDMDQL
jgi:hypothetical protein